MKYEKPEMSVLECDEEDVIRTSALTDVGTEDGDDIIDLGL